MERICCCDIAPAATAVVKGHTQSVCIIKKKLRSIIISGLSQIYHCEINITSVIQVQYCVPKLHGDSRIIYNSFLPFKTMKKYRFIGGSIIIVLEYRLFSMRFYEEDINAEIVTARNFAMYRYLFGFAGGIIDPSTD